MRNRPSRWRGAAPGRRGVVGTTLLELVVSSVVLAVLSTIALPVAHLSVRRQKEIELRRALRDIRLALDTYHFLCRNSTARASGTARAGKTGTPVINIKIEDDPGLTCYPESLDVLVDGVKTGERNYDLRFLRKIPSDPFNVSDDEHDEHGWRLRSTTDRKASSSWNRRNVFDVASANEFRALDGSYYKDW